MWAQQWEATEQDACAECVRMHVCKYVCMAACVCMYVHMCACLCVCVCDLTARIENSGVGVGRTARLG